MEWSYIPFEESIEKVTYTTKIPKKKFLSSGNYPIISQEAEFINGYWDNKDDVFDITDPVVIFGDHTKVVKHIDFNFVLGADGVKVLKPINELNSRFFAYFLESAPVADLGYARHYRLLKEISVPLPPISEQKRIVTILDQAFSDIEQARAKTEQNLKNARELMNVAYHDAITGKLTSVWREANQTVVTASDLLKQLKAKKKELVNEKKISREKALPELCKEKVSFDLPESWAWCCLGEIGNATNYPFVDGPFGSSINTKTDYLETGVPVLRMVNVKPFMFKDYDLKYVDEDKYQQFTRHNVCQVMFYFQK